MTAGAWHRWGAVLAYMTGLFALSSIPNPPAGPVAWFDKLIHLALYAGLGGVNVRALAGGRRSGITLPCAVGAVLIAIGYGVFDEFHQSFVAGRGAEFGDLVADAAGAGAAAGGLWVWSILAEQMKNAE